MVNASSGRSIDQTKIMSPAEKITKPIKAITNNVTDFKLNLLNEHNHFILRIYVSPEGYHGKPLVVHLPKNYQKRAG